MNKQIELRHINSHTGYDDEFSLGNKEADKLSIPHGNKIT